jgi:hypothetical protein
MAAEKTGVVYGPFGVTCVRAQRLLHAMAIPRPFYPDHLRIPVP